MHIRGSGQDFWIFVCTLEVLDRIPGYLYICIGSGQVSWILEHMYGLIHQRFWTGFLETCMHIRGSGQDSWIPAR